MSSSWSVEVEAQSPASKLFKAAFIDWHNLGPKVVPEVIASAVPISGHGSPGSIRQINFTSAMPFSYLKEQLEFIDHEKLELKASLVEGGGLAEWLECASSRIKVEPTAGSGAVVKMEVSCKALPGVDVSEYIKKAKESFAGMVKAADGYLLANPTAYA
ncbi:Pathogenesis-related protein 1 [Apostasia shenzhenica]|uniref:Pathogenesis-related protein 1 n=1 Tax=Apostasia shenzhenica TaxID=1088818 RepID=A0A2I0B359_9ASPA|nr:Pathogenesis-related protein 1 [Apostasia shenzhenica]